MLNKAKTLKGYTLASLDGEIGQVKEFYFDDQHWTVRYLVAETGDWLTDRQVLISPYALGAVTKDKQHIHVDLTRKQIEESPSLESDKPVSRQFEVAYYGYYNWPTYWGGPFMWGPSSYLVRDRKAEGEPAAGERPWDPHLRSTQDVSGHYVQATNGEIGHVEDFVIDDVTWAIRYLIVDTRNWWPGKKVLISPKWIERVSWSDSKVFINLRRETIKNGLEYNDGPPLTRDYETALHRQYNREGYWVEEPPAKERSL
jgi:hypothetical protein